MIKNFKYGPGLISALSFAVVLLIYGVIPVFAATNAVNDGFVAIMESIYRIIRTVSVPVGAVALAYCGFQVFTRGEQGMENAKRVGKYILIGVVVILLAEGLISLVQSWLNRYFVSSADALGLNPY